MEVAARSLFVFDDSFARELEGLYVPWRAARVAEPRLLALNEELAAELASTRRRYGRATAWTSWPATWCPTARHRSRRPMPAISSVRIRRASATAGCCCWARSSTPRAAVATCT